MADDMEWHIVARSYLDRLGRAEFQAGIARHLGLKRSARTYRHNPSDYMCALIRCMDRNDEEAFKALKAEQGYASAIKV